MLCSKASETRISNKRAEKHIRAVSKVQTYVYMKKSAADWHTPFFTTHF